MKPVEYADAAHSGIKIRSKFFFIVIFPCIFLDKLIPVVKTLSNTRSYKKRVEVCKNDVF